MSGLPNAGLAEEQQQPGGSVGPPAMSAHTSEEEFHMTPTQMPETPKEKFIRKMTQEPLVPIGSLLTCGALIVASRQLVRGERAKFNKALRWRVAFQGLTVLAALGGSYYYGQNSAAAVPAPPTRPADAPLQQGTVTTTPGRPPTYWQQMRADEKANKNRAAFQDRVETAADRELNDDKRLEEALLGKEEPLPAQPAPPKAQRPRPIIGQDSRRQV